MNPDRIVVGECRGPETMAMLWAFATGHAGMTSVHGDSAEHALRNLVRFALTSGARIDTQQALDWLREIDLVVHCDRPATYSSGERRFLPRHVDQIAELTGIEGNQRNPQPPLRRRRPRPPLPRRRQPAPSRTRGRRIPAMTRVLLLTAVLLIASGCEGANSHSAARLTTPTKPAQQVGVSALKWTSGRRSEGTSSCRRMSSGTTASHHGRPVRREALRSLRFEVLQPPVAGKESRSRALGQLHGRLDHDCAPISNCDRSHP